MYIIPPFGLKIQKKPFAGSRHNPDLAKKNTDLAVSQLHTEKSENTDEIFSMEKPKREQQVNFILAVPLL